MTVALDYDGVLYPYTKGWNGGVIDEPPTEGMVGAVKAILAVEAAFVLTARRDVEAVADWLRGAGLPALAPKRGQEHVPDITFWETRNLLLVTNRKLPARAYVDDRAVLFAGKWDATLRDLGIESLDVEETFVTNQLWNKVRALHSKDLMGFCATCFGEYSAYDDDHQRHLWPCPTLRAVAEATGAKL